LKKCPHDSDNILNMRNKILVIMGILGFLGFGCKHDSAAYEPYKDNSLNLIYNLLFCDNIDLYKTNTKPPIVYPWDLIFSDKLAENDLKKVTVDTTIESRLRILAYNRLRLNGIKITNKELLGVVIEIGLDNGLDVLAAYKDGRARYINQSGKMIVWETKDDNSERLINQLFVSGDNVVKQIRPWDKPRLAFPKKGNARVTFLVANGLYFGEASMNDLFNDPMAGPVLSSGAALIQYMMQKAENKK
jgi:hypothetical protein